MPMYPCNKCLENQWTFQLPDRYTVVATCKLCANEVQFATKKAKRAASSKRHGKAKVSTSDSTYVPIRHGEQDPGDDGWPPWIPLEERIGEFRK